MPRQAARCGTADSTVVGGSEAVVTQPSGRSLSRTLSPSELGGTAGVAIVDRLIEVGGSKEVDPPRVGLGTVRREQPAATANPARAASQPRFIDHIYRPDSGQC
jgi:hypothetical protein